MADLRQEIVVIYTDLRKAFDAVPHDLLLFKLQKYGISGRTLSWMKSFLTDRSQRVRINNSFSDTIKIESGVPQGGVLSGLLFIVYINDMPENLRYLKCSMYADDAKLFTPILSSDSHQQIQEDLNALRKWCESWRMRLNAEKCFLLHYKPRGRNSTPPHLLINNVPLETRETASDLGVIISHDLKFHEQVSAACKKATKQINIIKRTFVSRSPFFLLICTVQDVCEAPFRTLCIAVWNPSYVGDILSLEKTQNRFTKLLRHGSVMTSGERNVYLGISSHKARRLGGDLLFMYKRFDEGRLFQPVTNPRTRGHSKKICLEIINNSLRQHSFAVRSVREWNSLPEEIVSAPALNIFKNRLDSFMFD